MLQINAAIDPERKQDLSVQKALHLAKADKFYELKHKFKLRAEQATNDATMFLYDETTERKGQSDVTSLLLQYFYNQGAEHKDTLVLFSDGCPEQNKNYVMVRFLYYLVHGWKLFKKVLYYFPIRGHSRLPDDQDFSFIEAKERRNNAKIQSDWDKLIISSRENPSPFNLVKVKTRFF
nr:unnamed protein product [Callosobruchus analis]